MATATQTAIRLTPDDLALLDLLQSKLGLNSTDVIRLAVRRLAAIVHVELPPKRLPKPKP